MADYIFVLTVELVYLIKWLVSVCNNPSAFCFVGLQELGFLHSIRGLDHFCPVRSNLLCCPAC